MQGRRKGRRKGDGGMGGEEKGGGVLGRVCVRERGVWGRGWGARVINRSIIMRQRRRELITQAREGKTGPRQLRAPGGPSRSLDGVPEDREERLGRKRT